jgi:hypothetical protein
MQEQKSFDEKFVKIWCTFHDYLEAFSLLPIVLDAEYGGNYYNNKTFIIPWFQSWMAIFI